MPSPRRPLRGSPPRRALHERSESQTNERSLRLVGEPQAPFYGSPFPSKPSQILSPKGYNGQSSTIGAEPGLSPLSRNPPRDNRQSIAGSSNLARAPNTKRDSNTKRSDDVFSKRISSTSTSYSTPATDTPILNTSALFSGLDHPVEEEGRMSDDIVQLPSVPPKKRSLDDYTQESPGTLERQPVQTKDSESSLSSTNSTGTVIVKKNRDAKKCASYSAFPNVARLGSSKSSLSLSAVQKTNAQEPNEQVTSVSSASSGSPSAFDPTVSAERRTSSAPIYVNLQASSQSSITLQYPTIRPPSASASWVESSTSDSHRPERYHDRWNPHLSTVQSEGTGSQSEGRNSQSMWLSDSSRVSKSSSMALNGRGSSDLPIVPNSPVPEGSPDVPTLPSPLPVHRRDFTGSTIRVVSEQEDTVSKLQPIPGSRDSEHLGPPPAFQAKRKIVVARPSSRASFFRDSIPAWAKAYYARPQSSSSFLNRSTDSVNIFRPRTRNNHEPHKQQQRDSLTIEPVRPAGLNLTEVRGPPRRRISPSWSPHLWHDRMSLGRRRTIFHAPSVDERAEGKLPNKRNAQILLFMLGFIFTPGWFIASFLPLPPRPNIPSLKGKDSPGRTQIVEDLEKQLGPIDEARYENARWWRNINRIMSLIGVVIVVAVITIASVTAK